MLRHLAGTASATVPASVQAASVCIDIRLPDSFNDVVKAICNGLRMEGLRLDYYPVSAHPNKHLCIFVACMGSVERILAPMKRTHPADHMRLQSFTGSALEQQVIVTLLRRLCVPAGQVICPNTPGHLKLQQFRPVLDQLESHLLLTSKEDSHLGIRIVPLHSWHERRLLLHDWCSFSGGIANNEAGTPSVEGRRRDACDPLCQYFGPRIGFYFAWLRFHARSLLLPALVGAGVFCHQCLHGVDGLWLVAYSVLICTWSLFFARFWGFLVCELRIRWHCAATPGLRSEAEELHLSSSVKPGESATIGADTNTRMREALRGARGAAESGTEEIGAAGVLHSHRVGLRRDFRPRFRVSENGRRQELGDGHWRSSLPRTLIAAAALSASVAFVLCFAAWVVAFSGKLRRRFPTCRAATTMGSGGHGDEFGTLGCWAILLAPATVNTVVTRQLIRGFEWVSVRTTSWENHRTHLGYQQWLMRKLFLFQFVAHFAVLFLIAFWERDLEELRNFLAVSMVWDTTRSVFSGLLAARGANSHWEAHAAKRACRRAHLGAPAKHAMAVVSDAAGDRVANRQPIRDMWAAECTKPKFDSILYDYAEIACQMGRVMLFSAAFPLAPLLAMLNASIELRTHALKLLHGHQRPLAERIDDILVWDEILDSLGFLAVVTNCALMALTSTALEHEAFGALGATPMRRLFLAVGIEHVVFLLRKLFDLLVPKVPLHLKKQQLEMEVARLGQIYTAGIEEGSKRAVRHRKLSRNLERLVSRGTSSYLGETDGQNSDGEEERSGQPQPSHLHPETPPVTPLTPPSRGMKRLRSTKSGAAHKNCTVQ